MSRARRQLARRLEAKKAEATRNADPDAADSVALETADQLADEPYEQMLDLDTGLSEDVEDSGLQVTGLRTVGGMGGSASRFSGLFGSSDDSSSSGDDVAFDEDEAGRDETLGRPEGDYEDLDESSGASRQRLQGVNRRPSTTEAKERTPLDDEDDDDDGTRDLGQAFESKLAMRSDGPFADPVDVDESTSSDEDELVELRPRRTS